MKSLTFKLAGVFLALSLVPLVIGIGGAMFLQTAEQSLNDNNLALQNLTGLVSSAGDSLQANAELQKNADSVSREVAEAQEQTYSTLKEMGDYMLPRTFAIARMRTAIIETASAERALLLTLNMRHLDEDELKATRDAQTANIKAALLSLETARASYLSHVKGDSETEAWTDFEKALAAWRASHNDFMAEIASLEKLVDDLIRGGPLFASSARKAYDAAFVRGKDAREACEHSIDILSQAIIASAETDMTKALDSQTRSRTLVNNLGDKFAAAAARASDMHIRIEAAKTISGAAASEAAAALTETAGTFWRLVTLSALGIIVAVTVGLYFSWRISRPIRSMVRHLSRLAVGDLSGDVPAADRDREDEIGLLARSVQDMIHSTRDEIRIANSMADGDYTRSFPLRSDMDQLARAFRTMVKTTNETLSQVSDAVDRVGSGAAVVSGASHSLSQGAQTSATAIEQISQVVNQVDSQAKDNAKNATEANQLATASRDAARRGYDAVSELVTAMGEIRESGKRIASVAKLIDDIAFQTNLLALNAAVEAARAGRHGRGFSVVADEVRSLSARSARAARETSEMVAAMTVRMETGTQLAERSDHEFRDIVDATAQVARLFEDIVGASSAQSSAMAQIALGLNQIDSVIQENTHNAAQTASSAGTLSRQAEELRAMVSRFRLISGRSGGPDGEAGTEIGTAADAPRRPLSRATQIRLLSAPGRNA